MPEKTGEKKPPRVGFRRRVNPYYAGMTKREIAADTAKTAFRWLVFTVLIFVYWMALLLLFSIILLNVWKVKLIRIIIYAAILAAVSSAVYAGVLVHRKFYY